MLKTDGKKLPFCHLSGGITWNSSTWPPGNSTKCQYTIFYIPMYPFVVHPNWLAGHLESISCCNLTARELAFLYGRDYCLTIQSQNLITIPSGKIIHSPCFGRGIMPFRISAKTWSKCSGNEPAIRSNRALTFMRCKLRWICTFRDLAWKQVGRRTPWRTCPCSASLWPSLSAVGAGREFGLSTDSASCSWASKEGINLALANQPS